MSAPQKRVANFRAASVLALRVLGAGFALTLLALADPAVGDVRRMEAVGAEPIRANTRIEVPLRDAARKRAVHDAVVRVARDLLAPELPPDESAIDSPPGTESREPDSATPEEKLEDRLAAALGDDPLDYAVRFRILEDRGERPALFVDDPEVESEYVIVVEVFVDVKRVRRRLERKGFALISSGDGERVRIRLELLDVDRYAAYEKFRVALAADSRVRSVVPVVMERGRAVLEVDSGHRPEALLDRLYQVIPAEIEIEPLAIDEGGLTLRVRLLEIDTDPGVVAAPGN